MRRCGGGGCSLRSKSAIHWRVGCNLNRCDGDENDGIIPAASDEYEYPTHHCHPHYHHWTNHRSLVLAVALSLSLLSLVEVVDINLQYDDTNSSVCGIFVLSLLLILLCALRIEDGYTTQQQTPLLMLMVGMHDVTVLEIVDLKKVP
jgi:hypothetical protein